MALSLGVKAGSKIKIGEDYLMVNQVLAMNAVGVTFKGKTYEVTDQERHEILPGVFLSCGSSKTDPGHYTRIAIEAPRRLRIERVP